MLIRILCYVLVLLCFIEPLLVSSDSTTVRLVGGHSNATGLVELFVKGEWVTVFSDKFKYYDGVVVCRMLGFNDSLVRIYSDGNALFGTTGDNTLIRTFGCNGNEADLNECSSPSSWHPTGHLFYMKDAGLTCEDTELRLVDGDTNQSGRVEIFFNGDWRTVCDEIFDWYDARVICNSLGFSNTGIVQAYKGSHYGQGYGYSILSKLNCQGSETDIKYCAGTWSQASQCDRRHDAGVNCGGTQIRLVNGPTNTSGRVEVYHNGYWGTICGDGGFSIQNAYVICRMLGIHKDNAIAYSFDYYGQGLHSITISHMKCDGSESDIASCYSPYEWGSPYQFCAHQEDVGVNCDGVTPMRLADGVSEKSGRVEVLHNGHWGTVADRNFDGHDLAVICRMLGYEITSMSFYMTGSYFGQGFGEVVVNSLNCDGGENDIGYCGANWWPNTGISDHNHDVGVSCDGRRNTDGRVKHSNGVLYKKKYIPLRASWSNRERLVSPITYSGPKPKAEVYVRGLTGRSLLDQQALSDIPIKLVGGKEGGSSGRVEILHNGNYGTICTNYFDRPALRVICRMLGFDNIPSSAYWRTAYVQGLGEIVMSNINCNGIENNIGQCGATWPASSTCTHSNDLYVNCQGEVEKLRLVDGRNAHSGRVEIFHEGQWATICDNGFGRADAVVVCRVLNFDHPENAVFYSGAQFGSVVNDTVPIVMTELNCNGLETNLGQCSPVWGNRYCTHNRDIGVDCCPSCNSPAIVG